MPLDEDDDEVEFVGVVKLAPPRFPYPKMPTPEEIARIRKIQIQQAMHPNNTGLTTLQNMPNPNISNLPIRTPMNGNVNQPVSHVNQPGAHVNQPGSDLQGQSHPMANNSPQTGVALLGAQRVAFATNVVTSGGGHQMRKPTPVIVPMHMVSGSGNNPNNQQQQVLQPGVKPNNQIGSRPAPTVTSGGLGLPAAPQAPLQTQNFAPHQRLVNIMPVNTPAPTTNINNPSIPAPVQGHHVVGYRPGPVPAVNPSGLAVGVPYNVKPVHAPIQASPIPHRDAITKTVASKAGINNTVVQTAVVTSTSLPPAGSKIGSVSAPMLQPKTQLVRKALPSKGNVIPNVKKSAPTGISIPLRGTSSPVSATALAAALSLAQSGQVKKKEPCFAPSGVDKRTNGSGRNAVTTQPTVKQEPSQVKLTGCSHSEKQTEKVKNTAGVAGLSVRLRVLSMDIPSKPSPPTVGACSICGTCLRMKQSAAAASGGTSDKKSSDGGSGKHGGGGTTTTTTTKK